MISANEREFPDSSVEREVDTSNDPGSGPANVARIYDFLLGGYFRNEY